MEAGNEHLLVICAYVRFTGIRGGKTRVKNNSQFFIGQLNIDPSFPARLPHIDGLNFHSLANRHFINHAETILDSYKVIHQYRKYSITHQEVGQGSNASNAETYFILQSSQG